MAEEDYRFKIILLGNIDVGKTSLILRFSAPNIKEGKFTESIKAEIDQRVKDVQVDDNLVKIIIADTAGQERFRTLTSSFYRNADAMILVFDITCQTSFEEIEEHFQEGMRYSQRSYKILVGNKIDLGPSRQVSFDAAKEAAERFNVPYFETSAKEGINVEEIFVHIARSLIDNSGGQQTNRNGVVKLAQSPANTEKKKKICNSM